MDGGAWWAAVHGVAKSQTRLSDFTFNFPFMHWRRKWQPTPGFLPGESQGQRNLVGCLLWGRTESDTTEATQQVCHSFPPKEKVSFNFMSAVTVYSNFGTPKIKPVSASTLFPFICHKVIYYVDKKYHVCKRIKSTRKLIVNSGLDYKWNLLSPLH